jgi:hypothetical protein
MTGENPQRKRIAKQKATVKTEAPIWSKLTDELAKTIYDNAVKKSLWRDVELRHIHRFMPLVFRSLMRAMFAYRSTNRYCAPHDELKMYPAWHVYLADAIILLFEFSAASKIPIGEIILRKVVHLKGLTNAESKRFEDNDE